MAPIESQDAAKAPAFQFYPKDFLADSNVIGMSLQERGAYVTLLCLCWIDGSLPMEFVALSRRCGVPANVMRKIWPALAPCFREDGEGHLTHPRLDREREKQAEFRRRQGDNGRLGGRPRNPEQPKPFPEQPKPSENITQTEPKKSSPICDLRSASSDSRQERARVVPRDPSPSEVSDAVAERAGRFCERYAEMYAKHRKGARYLGKPALDFQEALQLVGTWDDARLDKIAQVFLTTDHDFAEKGSRTMAQFRAMASWCDSKLVEAGIA